MDFGHFTLELRGLHRASPLALVSGLFHDCLQYLRFSVHREGFALSLIESIG
jgi:hypothetical protein